MRFTADVDVVLDLQEHNLRRASAALAGLGYRPRAPVAFDDFLDPSKRAAWVRDNGLTVFSLYSPEHPATEVDLFVEAPFNFDEAYARAVRMELAPDVVATFVGLDDLLALKHTPEHVDGIWEQGWDGHERSQMRRLAVLSLAEKIQWLEEAQELVLHLSQARHTSVAATQAGHRG